MVKSLLDVVNQELPPEYTQNGGGKFPGRQRFLS